MAWTNTGTDEAPVWEFTADADYSQGKWSAANVNGETGVDNSSSLEELRRAQAEAAGVQDARHAGYAEVLANYANRSDVETLADRRARELATDPGQQSFTRQAEYNAFGGTSDQPLTQYPADANWTEVEFNGPAAQPEPEVTPPAAGEGGEDEGTP